MTNWDTELESKWRTEFQSYSDEELIRRLSTTINYMERQRATYELTRRALDNHALLASALVAIDLDHIRPTLSSPSIGWFAAARIIASERPNAIAALLDLISCWNASERQDFLEWCLPREKFVDTVLSLSNTYGWTPGFVVEHRD